MPTLKKDQRQLNATAAEPIGNFTINGTQHIAHTFIPSVSGTLDKLHTSIRKANSPANLEVAIYAVDGSNKPTGSALATETVLASAIPDTVAIPSTTITFSSPASLTASTTYAIVLRQVADGGDASNFYRWRGTTSNVYASGVGWQSFDSGSSWVSGGSGDHSFVTEMSVVVATPGLDQFAFGGTVGGGMDRVDTDGNEQRSQTFTPSISAILHSVELGINRRNSQTGGQITVEIQGTDGANKPNGTAISSVETILDTALPTASSNNKLVVAFATAPSLTASTLYAIVVKFPNASPSTGYDVHHTYTQDQYSGGQHWKSTDNGSIWNSDTNARDLQFGTLMLEPTTTTQTINSDAHIQATTEQTILSNAFVGQETTQNILSDALVVLVTIQNILSDAFVGQETTQTILSNAAVGATATEIILSDAFVGQETLQTINSNAHIQAETTQLLYSDTDIIFTVTQTITSDARVLKTISQFLSAAASVALITTQTIDSNAVVIVKEPVLKLFVVT